MEGKNGQHFLKILGSLLPPDLGSPFGREVVYSFIHEALCSIKRFSAFFKLYVYVCVCVCVCVCVYNFIWLCWVFIAAQAFLELR